MPESSLPRPLRVLIAEDCPDTRATLRALLLAWGHEVAVAADGAAAVELAGTFGPDVCLLDIGMPRLDGYQAAQQIRELPGLRRAVLVAVTAYGREEDVRQALASGFDLHLVKASDPGDLERMLECCRRPGHLVG